MKSDRINKPKLLESLPPEWPERSFEEIQAKISASKRKIVVLDDDPTGTQTVHGIRVLTGWSVESLQSELRGDQPAFYILTNSRSLPLADAQAMNVEIGSNLNAASLLSKRDLAVVSRSDSTLRGHFPGEVQVLSQAIGQSFDAWLVIPFFLEGGRYTINDIHYVADGNDFIPAGETEFARDTVFGYQSSNLRLWVEEKTDGRIKAYQVASISIEDIRMGGPSHVERRLLELAAGQICVVNAASYADLEVFVLGLLNAESQGRRYLYRTAASFVRVRAGIAPRPLLESADLDLARSGGGLIVAGSYVPKTSAQIENLRSDHKMVEIELDVQSLLGAQRMQIIQQATKTADAAIENGQNVLIYTSRKLISGPDESSSLQIGQRVSQSLVDIIHAIQERPRYIIAKGGITSSDIATGGLNVQRADVLGQIIPGVPVWRLGNESRFPGMPYIVFPGNVGGPEAIAEIVDKLSD